MHYSNRKAVMQQSTTAAKIGSLLTGIIGLTIFISYIPHELTLIRATLSMVQLALMAVVMIVALRSVIREL